jgi:hypothetical protein
VKYYLDTEFDGHGGPLLSLALVSEDGLGCHYRTGVRAMDLWVIRNVEPLMDQHDADIWATLRGPNYMGSAIREFIERSSLGGDEEHTIIADSPVDIGRFCEALSTGDDGVWISTEYPHMTFEVHNVACYPTTLPGAVQHNAWWDAMALRHLLTTPKEAVNHG